MDGPLYVMSVFLAINYLFFEEVILPQKSANEVTQQQGNDLVLGIRREQLQIKELEDRIRQPAEIHAMKMHQKKKFYQLRLSEEKNLYLFKIQKQQELHQLKLVEYNKVLSSSNSFIYEQ